MQKNSLNEKGLFWMGDRVRLYGGQTGHPPGETSRGKAKTRENVASDLGMREKWQSEGEKNPSSVCSSPSSQGLV